MVRGRRWKTAVGALVLNWSRMRVVGAPTPTGLCAGLRWLRNPCKGGYHPPVCRSRMRVVGAPTPTGLCNFLNWCAILFRLSSQTAVPFALRVRLRVRIQAGGRSLQRHHRWLHLIRHAFACHLPLKGKAKVYANFKTGFSLGRGSCKAGGEG